MSDFLTGYGVEEERRERLIKRVALALLIVLAVGGGLYLALRTYPARRQVNQFLDYLRRQDYQGAYRMWGCTETSPCRDYSFEKFLEDWGPKSAHADARAARIRGMSARSCGPGVLYTLGSLAAHALGEKGCDCGSGVIHTVAFPGGEEVALWYDRKEKALGFAPWPACLPQLKAWQ
jgi:hypothetical protein